jgi:hypothetical protein
MIPREIRPNYIMAVETGSQRQEINLAISLAKIPSVIVSLSAAKVSQPDSALRSE